MLSAQKATGDNLVHEFENAVSTECNLLLRVLKPTDPVLDFARSVVAGLEARPRRLECRFLYDSIGSEIYEKICAQPEYYPTRTEAAILAEHAPRLPALTGPVTLIELGSGSSEKTDHLLQAYQARQGRTCYLPIDVSDRALSDAGEDIVSRHSRIQVIGVHGIYQDAFPLIASASPVMVIFLGSTIGNFDHDEADRFWTSVARHLPRGDHFLLGVDLVKDPRRLEAAYNDAAGLSAAFSLNLFARMNRELGAKLDLSAIRHVATYNPAEERIEIRAEFERDQDLTVAPLGRVLRIAAGEQVQVEFSHKYRLATLVPCLESYGLGVREIFSDPDRSFAVLLLKKEGRHG